jgi:leucyl/phenylalanyl-tRNA--protein transferase
VPVYQIPDEQIIFPHPSKANSDGLLGIGGKLEPERILLAYQNGIFPWYSFDEPVMWWCLTPRLILFPEKIHLSKSMNRYIQQNNFHFSFDTHFESVMLQCKTINRKDQNGSWIHEDVLNAFIKLHQMGIAHSIEIWEENELIGGTYGLAIGKMFCGESMFSKKSNASKFALIQLSRFLISQNFDFIDCQQDTPHLRSMGAELISKKIFFEMLEKNKEFPLKFENWSKYSNQSDFSEL